MSWNNVTEEDLVKESCLFVNFTFCGVLAGGGQLALLNFELLENFVLVD